MRYGTSAIIAAWTAGMAVVFGWGLYILGWTLKVTVIDGKPILRDPPMSWAAGLLADLLFFSARRMALGLHGTKVLVSSEDRRGMPGSAPLRSSSSNRIPAGGYAAGSRPNHSGTVRSTAWCALDAALRSLGIRPARCDLGGVLTGAQIVTTVVTRSEGAWSAWSRTWPVA